MNLDCWVFSFNFLSSFTVLTTSVCCVTDCDVFGVFVATGRGAFSIEAYVIGPGGVSSVIGICCVLAGTSLMRGVTFGAGGEIWFSVTTYVDKITDKYQSYTCETNHGYSVRHHYKLVVLEFPFVDLLLVCHSVLLLVEWERYLHLPNEIPLKQNTTITQDRYRH